MIKARESQGALPALLGGDKAVASPCPELFAWPIVTAEDEEAALDVLRRGAMSGIDVTQRFEQEYARWQGSRHALAFNNGTAALHAAMYGCGVGVGDELICPSVTYWASCLPCFSLGATVVFADIDPGTLCLDPADVERRVTGRTKAIVAVHYLGHPADMEGILEVARRHRLKVIEDCSHAHGALYRGRKVGTFGHAAAASLMSGKPLAAGEGGMLTTDDEAVLERALAFGHHGRAAPRPGAAASRLPLGGCKYRMHQVSSAVGRVQLRHYDRRAEEIRRAMNHFWDLLEGVPGLRAHRPPSGAGTDMGGWYAPRGLYRAEELHGLSVTGFCRAVRAEGVEGCHPGANAPLHLHPLFNSVDVYGHGVPTRTAHARPGLLQPPGSLPVSEGLGARTFSVPWFKRHRPGLIAEYARAFRKAAESAERLRATDPGDPPQLGSWGLFAPSAASRPD